MSGWTDTDGDGVGNYATFDTTGDGVDDLVLLDSDNDHVIDTRGTDTDSDGGIDQSEVDTNRDGSIDEIRKDTDKDGVEDTILRDRGDGVFETYMEPGPTDPREAIMDATVVSAPTNPDPLIALLENPDITADSRKMIENYQAQMDQIREGWL
ncbi:hypothetical protein WJX64_02885 [Leifsonia sp. YIM 134122]|uniref:Calcium-binding protein n=1 Tax=Leifsonia stereocauli TaxID=3134136 RepID=A0ABU9W0G7_9MICO